MMLIYTSEDHKVSAMAMLQYSPGRCVEKSILSSEQLKDRMRLACSPSKGGWLMSSAQVPVVLERHSRTPTYGSVPKMEHPPLAKNFQRKGFAQS